MENNGDTPWSIASKEFACDHKLWEKRFVTWKNSAGSQYFGFQCARCGVADRMNRADLKVDPRTAAPKNQELADSWIDRRNRRFKQLRDQQQKREESAREAVNREWRHRYESHMNSPKWREIRSRVLERAAGLCEGCRMRKPVQVHHRSYDNLGNEFLWELAAVCLECHERFHQK